MISDFLDWTPFHHDSLSIESTVHDQLIIRKLTFIVNFLRPQGSGNKGSMTSSVFFLVAKIAKWLPVFWTGYLQA